MFRCGYIWQQIIRYQHIQSQDNFVLMVRYRTIKVLLFYHRRVLGSNFIKIIYKVFFFSPFYIFMYNTITLRDINLMLFLFIHFIQAENIKAKRYFLPFLMMLTYAGGQSVIVCCKIFDTSSYGEDARACECVSAIWTSAKYFIIYIQ